MLLALIFVLEGVLHKSSGIEEHLDLRSPSDLKAMAIDDANAKRKKARTCFNSFCQTDPNNPNLWSKGRVQAKMTCKICEEAWKKQQYCFFCKQVYIEDGEGYSDSKPWIDCDICKRWVQFIYYNSFELINILYFS